MTKFYLSNINKNILYSVIFISLFFYSTFGYCGKIVYPYRATTAIVLKGETFQVWFNTTSGQTVNSVTLRGPYNTVDAAITSTTSGTWVYDQWSGKTFNLKLTVTVPATAPADRYDLILKTSTGDEISLAAVKVIKEYKSSYFIFHLSDGHRWEKITERDSMTSLREQNAILSVASIINPEMIIETGDNMWGNNETLTQKMKRANTVFSGGSKGTEKIMGLNEVNAAVFWCPGNHDAHTNGYENTTVPVCARDWNDLFGLENHSFKYGNQRFFGINNSWCSTTGGGTAGYVPNYKWQIDEAINWMDSVGAGNFRMSFQHVPQESLPPIYNRFKADSAPLGLMIAGHIHRYTTNPYSIDGKPIIYTVAIYGTASDNAPFNLYKIDNDAGTYTPYPNSFANNEATTFDQDYSTIKLTLNFSKENDGSNIDNKGTIVNKFPYAIPSCRIRFVMPRSKAYSISNGTISQEFDGTYFHIVDVSVDLPPNSKQDVSISAIEGADLCPNDPNKTTPGICGCGVLEGTCNGININGIEVLPEKVKLNIYETKKLVANITPSNATDSLLIWSSNNSSVVKVEPITGLITAKSGGTAIIQANSIIEGKTAVSEITVIPDSLTLQAEDAVFDGTVSKDQNGFNGTGFLELASHKTDSITWTVNVNSTSTYSLSFRYALFSGSYKEKLTINGEVRSNTLTFPSTGGFNIWKNIRTKQVLNAGSNTIKLSLIGLVGPRIDELAISNAMDGVAPDSITGATSINFSKTVNTINIYPNPLNAGTLSIDLIGYENMRDVQLKIVNLMGQAVYQKSLNNPTHFEINTTGILEKSVYFITVKSEGFTTFKKLIVN